MAPSVGQPIFKAFSLAPSDSHRVHRCGPEWSWICHWRGHITNCVRFHRTWRLPKAARAFLCAWLRYKWVARPQKCTWNSWKRQARTCPVLLALLGTVHYRLMLLTEVVLFLTLDAERHNFLVVLSFSENLTQLSQWRPLFRQSSASVSQWPKWTTEVAWLLSASKHCFAPML